MTVYQRGYLSAREIVQALGGRWHGSYGTARCPAHDDRSPSLSMRDREDGHPLVRCHAGCTQEDVIAALRARELWHQQSSFISIGKAPRRAFNCVSDENPHRDAAMCIWRESVTPTNTLVETYLRSRRITGPVPPSLRFHPGLKHALSGEYFPAMVGAVQAGNGSICAIHRTFLRHDGSGKAPVEPAKMMLGACRGGVVRLGRHGGRLLVGEGIESTLSAMQASGLPGWAALSTSGLKVLDLPSDVSEVIIAADNDVNGAGQRAAEEAARRWIAEGRKVRIALPEMPGTDFNNAIAHGVAS